MKDKKTKREMKASYGRIIGINCQKAQHLLAYEEPIAYSERAEGWACDYYDVDGVLISTGSAPLDSKRAKYDNELVRKYDKAADKVACDYSLQDEEKKKQVHALLKGFIEEATI